MNAHEFVEKLNNGDFPNGTKFEISKQNEVIGIIGVIDTTIVYLDIKVVPNDLLINKDYIFKIV